MTEAEGHSWLDEFGEDDKWQPVRPDLRVIQGGDPPPTVDEYDKTLTSFSDDNARRAYARRVAASVVTGLHDEIVIQDWRDRLKETAGLSGRVFDAIRADNKRAHRRPSRDGDAFREGITEARLLPEPGAPERVARSLLETLPSTDGIPHRAWWRDEFYDYIGTRWEVAEKSVIQYWIYKETRDAAYLEEGPEGRVARKWWNPNKTKVEYVAHALGVGVIQRFGEADETIAFTNGVLDPDLRARRLLPHHPRRFNLHNLPFAFDPDAHCPAWVAFLAQVLPDDDEQDAVLFLQEWFGYVVSGRTDLHKIASLIGDKRCGKGTIARVLVAMIGEAFVSGPKLGQLAGQFGLEPLINKRLAVMGDVRWNHRNAADAIEVLLGVSGGDHGTVHRKNRTAWEGTLKVRFLLMSNDEPKFNDASGAMATRMIHVAFRQSFYGREDPTLTDKLLTELPGILNWALQGLDRLNTNGGFTVPRSSLEVDENVQRVASPAQAFIEDKCIREEGAKVSLPDLFEAWQEWLRHTGRPELIASMDAMSSLIRSATRSGEPRVTSKRQQLDGVRTTWFHNLRLRNVIDDAKDRDPVEGLDDERWLVSGQRRS